ncbi:alpha/beta hydrolase [Litorilituus sediminis]|uniref:Alpha/beta hydrolase n=1 Tax=Litorilituus sediminis TaxID=718192 RepID=A0A4P6P5W2_9GAMM|nr:alpha/beta fold hydrolase [Litorilituus sediminis]QBG34735.1 alpha/beta hydrolase [Litorilituus sediminis]
MRITHCLALMTGLLFSTQVLANEQLVSVHTETGTLQGSLLDVEGETKTVALIIAGSGPTDRNGNNPKMVNNSLKMLANALGEKGISSLRYDKRGIGASKTAGLAEKNLRFEHYIEDANAWLDYLANNKQFEQIIVIGHSEGALIGMLAAHHKQVDKYISLAGVGQPIDETIRQQLSKQAEFVLTNTIPILEKLKQGQTVDNVPNYLMSLFRPSVQPYMISWLKYDPQKEIAQLNKPILLVQGETDLQVTVADVNKLAKANNAAEKVIITKMNHIFKEASINPQANFATYNQADLPIMPELVEAIVQFINRVSR